MTIPNPQREALVMAREALAGYETWEAALIESSDAWAPEGMADLPRFTEPLWDALMELQTKRNNIMEAIDAALAAPGGDTRERDLEDALAGMLTVEPQDRGHVHTIGQSMRARELLGMSADMPVALWLVRRHRPTPTQDGGDG